jgi:hypothetical protein
MATARGEFAVTLPPITPWDVPAVGALCIDKTFTGDLVGASKGAMLSTGTSEPTSAAYVALEWVQGVLHGKAGTFALQHTGVMDRGAGHLTVSVVPDSGTGDLTGITGQMAIEIVDGAHHYTFDYEL